MVPLYIMLNECAYNEKTTLNVSQKPLALRFAFPEH